MYFETVLKSYFNALNLYLFSNSFKHHNVDLYLRWWSLMTYCKIILITNLSSIIVFSYLLISIELGCYCDPIFFDHEANSELFIYSSSVVHCLLSLCQELFYLQHSKRCPLANNLQRRKISISNSMYLLLGAPKCFQRHAG